MPRHRYSIEHVEEIMIPKIVAALYPILIPIEQQDCRVQAKNHERVTEVARQAWRAFIGDRKPVGSDTIAATKREQGPSDSIKDASFDAILDVPRRG